MDRTPKKGIPRTMSVRLIWIRIARDVIRFLTLCLRPRTSLAAENLFLRKQLAFYQERKVCPRRADNATRLTMVLLGRHFDWRNALTVVKPRTFVTWHRKGFRLFWRWKSEAGRRPRPAELQQLIRRMARENPTWGEERIANELLLLKLGLRVSPRTVRKYLAEVAARTRLPSSRRSTLGDFSDQSRAGDYRLRFLRRSDGDLSYPLRVGRNGACLASIDSSQRHRPSYRRVDATTGARGNSFRQRVSFHHPRPRLDLLLGSRCFAGPAGSQSGPNASPQPTGERDLRASCTASTVFAGVLPQPRMLL